MKIIRACTVSMSVGFVEGMLPDLMKKYEVVLLSSPGPELDAAREKHGVRTIEVPMERHISLKRDVAALWQLVKVFRRERPTIVHSMTPKAGMLCMVAAWMTRVPVRVHTFTGLVFPTATGLKRRVLMTTDWLTCACATHVIPEGEGVKNDLLKNGITRKPLRVLGYGNVRGVNMERFSRRPEVMELVTRKSLKSQNCFTFLFVGRIVRDKGINELVSAFTRLYKADKGIRLVLVGWFEDELDPISEDTRRSISECAGIEAVGEKTGDELLAYYAASDCFVFPSYREGFPNTVLEAGAMGLPSIVTDINGSREIISLTPNPIPEHRSPTRSLSPEERGTMCHLPVGKIEMRMNGIIIPPKDEDALYEAMWRIYHEPEKCKAMATEARPMIASRFEQSFVRKCLYDFYDEILSDGERNYQKSCRN